MQEYRDTLVELHALREGIAETEPTFADEYIAKAEFSETVVELFRGRAERARAGVEKVREVIDRVSIEILELEKKPTVDLRRKVAAYNDVKGDEILMQRLRSEAQQLPLEYQEPKSEGNWLPAKMLGGGMSAALLWLDVDPVTGIIRNRVVRKDTPVTRPEWAGVTRWHGDLRSATNRVPLEYHCQKAMQERREAEFVLPV